MTFDELFNRTVVFKDCELLKCEKGEVSIRVSVNESNTNPYGMAHGGFLYTLCDNLAGLIGYTLGYYTVTLQAGINYLKGADLNDVLTVEGKTLHCGKSTDVTEVNIYNESGTHLVRAEFTMFNISEVPEEDRL